MTSEHNERDQESEQQAPEQVEAAPAPSKPKGPTPGELLTKAREAKKLSQQDVADRLRLRRKLVELIEDDDYRDFASATFVKGYLRAYAKLLEIDDREVFEAYGNLGYEEPQTINMQSFSRRKNRERSESRLMMITYAILVVVIGAAITWWWQEPDLSLQQLSDRMEQSLSPEQDSETAAQDEGIPLTERVDTPSDSATAQQAQPLLESEVSADDASTALTRNDPAQPEDTGAQQQGAEQPPADVTNDNVEQTTDTNNSTAAEQNNEAVKQEDSDSAPVTTEPTASDATAEQTASQQQSPAAPLVLTFKGDCWVKIEDATGEVVAVGVKPMGYEMPVQGKAPFTLTLGAPEVVDITFNEQSVDMSQFRVGRVARFTLPLNANE
ncbi:DUF4115 domain-containing protein [Idiomarina tyrosinivorans]|uniref:DUF4115 domain-containing protein n=1 Tax=Idiomarina tyrosinivorans TaxID=1445662 RepID=A0A432ZQX9_9GAMM|nr:RodZ domain-containing protein [Idiomarina tyrosinivorans]RUO80310.1 DUF4115 domain-containing protein [Idiomarina tyrosinivorans]